jgi:hypothetical protein
MFLFKLPYLLTTDVWYKIILNGSSQKTPTKKFDVVILPDFPTIENLTPTTLVYMKEFNGQTDLLDILYLVGWPMRQKGNHTCSKATISRKLIITYITLV